MGWTVKYNHLGEVADRLPRYIDKGLKKTADEMVVELKSTLWVDTGLLRRVTSERGQGAHAYQVVIGYNRGRGFYAAYQEYGTRRQAARPIVGPLAEAFRPRLYDAVAEQVREACDV